MNINTIDLVLSDKENIVKYIPLIKEYTNETVGTIKDKALKEIPIVVCEYTKNTRELEQLFILINALEKKGANVKIIRNSRNKHMEEIDLSIIENLIESGRIIDEQVSRTIDLEVGE